MKKIIILLLLFSLTLGLLASCTPNDTSSVGNDISNEISTDVSDEVSTEESNTVVEVTDEAIISEIKALLEKYNEYVLIVNMCEGALEYEEEAIDYTISYEQWFESDFTKNIVEGIVNSPKLNFYGNKITDERFRDADSFEKMLLSIYTKELADTYFQYEFAYGWKHEGFTCKYNEYSNYPLFNYLDGYNYSTLSFNDTAVLHKRYIDTDSLKIVEGTKGYIVTARGSAAFIDGEVAAPDSDVKMLIVKEDGSLRISYSEAKRDHIKTSDALQGNEDDVKTIINKLVEMNDLLKNRDGESISVQPDSLPIYHWGLYFWTQGEGWRIIEKDCILISDEIFKNSVDIYDWSFTLLNNEAALNFNRGILYGYIDSGSHEFPRVIYESDRLNGFVVGENDRFDLSMFYFVFGENYLENYKVTETNYGYIISNEDDTFNFISIEKTDTFGDGEYTLKISGVKSRYDLTDEEKALLGIN